jgi:hypothetical protein
MLITSRSYTEYLAMFGLSAGDLAGCRGAGGVLDVCAGGSSFVAECGQRGIPALAIDPAYARSVDELAVNVRAAVDGGHAMIAEHADRFVWDFYGDIDGHRATREVAAALFLADLRTHPRRYVAAELPRLPLRDGAADLVLCSHLLFTWSEMFDEAWHRAALRELVRVARREVRIFPLVTAGSGDDVPYLDALLIELERDGVICQLRPVPYEFQRGADTALVLTAAPSAKSYLM